MAYKDPENTLVLETTKGKVVIELLPDLAPGHVGRIKELARDGFYNGIAFHRVIPIVLHHIGLRRRFALHPNRRGGCGESGAAERGESEGDKMGFHKTAAMIGTF